MRIFLYITLCGAILSFDPLFVESVAAGDKAKPPEKTSGPDDKTKKDKEPSMPLPREILAPSVQDRLKLTEAQRKELAELQKEMEARLGSILTPEQRALIREWIEKKAKGPKSPSPDKK